jgi:hypothetical protein
MTSCRSSISIRSELILAAKTTEFLRSPIVTPSKSHRSPFVTSRSHHADITPAARLQQAGRWLAVPGLEGAEGFAHWVGHGRKKRADAKVPAWVD